MNKRNMYLKKASILLIIGILVLSTISVSANTNNNIKVASISVLDHSVSAINLEKKEINSANSQSINRGLLWDNGLPDERNGLSCVLYLSYPLDRELVDDFEVPEPGWIVNDGHFRIITNLGSGPEVLNKVRVFFYQTISTCEPDTTRYVEREATFDAYLTGDTYFYRPEIAVDCEFEGVELSPGKWWVCFQPELEENCFWLTSEDKGCPIWLSYPDLGYLKWSSSMDAFGTNYDLSFQLTGEVLKAELEINGLTGGFGLSANVKNIGTIPAENVVWEVKLEGGIILAPSGGVKTGGPLNIPVGGEQAINVIAFGIGGLILPLNVIITASADNADPVSQTAPSKLILIFVDI